MGKMLRVALASGVAALALAVFALAPVRSAARADQMTLRLEVYGLMGLHVLTLHSAIEETGGRYAITTDYATRGVAGLLVDLATKAQVEGRLGNPAVRPISFRRDTRRNGEARHEKVDYGPDGSVDGSSTPPPPTPVPATAARGTVDNLTAYFMLERQLARTGSCALSVPVFDGRYRYDLYFTDAGHKKLSSVAGQDFSGDTIACHMQRRDVSTLSEPEQNEGAKQGTIWYAKLLPGDAMVPVRMQMEAQIGVVDGYLAEVHGKGVNLKLME
ncbi:MAG: DUF3108 domain-containing protein [Thiohalocapsa sp.]